MIYHNSFSNVYRKPLGAVPEGTEITLFLKCDENYDECRLRVWTHEDRESLYIMEKAEGGFIIKILFERMGICWYYFILMRDEKQVYYCCKDRLTGGEGKMTSEVEGSFQITVYHPELRTPRWFKSSIMYQIFPDRFNRRGIINRGNKTRIIHYNWNEKPHYLETGSNNYDFFGGEFQWN